MKSSKLYLVPVTGTEVMNTLGYDVPEDTNNTQYFVESNEQGMFDLKTANIYKLEQPLNGSVYIHSKMNRNNKQEIKPFTP